MAYNILSNYKPIDYQNWIMGDSARKAVNLKRLKLLRPIELKIFNNASPYNDARNDPGQAELVVYFAVRLLEYKKEGSRSVVVPAAILHDIGYYFDEPTAWKKLVKSGANIESEAVRRPHQNRGLMLAGRILEKVKYPENNISEIADIIGDHDTRKLPTSESGKIVRAADLLWRVTYPCLNIYFGDATPKEAFEKMENSALRKPEPFDLDTIAMSIGRVELVNTMVYKFRDKCYDLLKKRGYQKELTKVSL